MRLPAVPAASYSPARALCPTARLKPVHRGLDDDGQAAGLQHGTHQHSFGWHGSSELESFPEWSSNRRDRYRPAVPGDAKHATQVRRSLLEQAIPGIHAQTHIHQRAVAVSRELRVNDVCVADPCVAYVVDQRKTKDTGRGRKNCCRALINWRAVKIKMNGIALDARGNKRVEPGTKRVQP